MFASSLEPRAKRRGIVLVVVLGMLGLMALIGVTFATFAGQSLIASRNFGQGVARPQAEALMDYALAQLINDTNNPVSAIRGHSLLRDMYGNDSVYRGVNPSSNASAELGGVLSSVYIPGSGLFSPQFTAVALRSSSTTSPSPSPFYNQVQFKTNIPTGGQYYGLDFTRWILTFQGTPANAGANTTNNVPINGNASATYEVLEDDATSGPVHLFTLSNNLTNPTIDPFNNGGTPPQPVASDWMTFTYPDANYISPSNGVSTNTGSPTSYNYNKAWASLAREWNGSRFVLDGRYMRAFNGPGLTQAYGNVYPYNLAGLANFRITKFDPDSQGMDEDYDACDLENWFLAIQSADGQVVVPSFHRPGILTANDWITNPVTNPQSAAKILRPRQADNSPLFPADPSVPDSRTGKLAYDIDNDGDGITDSVWVDLGYPVQRDPIGKLYKPLFAFMVIGLNGRLPLNTVGNLQARANADTANSAAVLAIDPTLVIPPTTGQVPVPGIYSDPNNAYYKSAKNNAFFGLTPVSSQTYLDAPLWDHASHLGYSVNEINPKFALQNAPSNVYSSATSINGSFIGANVNGNNFSQVDDVGVSVALTQLRNILAGTIPTDLPTPYVASALPINANNPVAPANGDINVVIVDGNAWVLPNNMADLNDYNSLKLSSPYPVERNFPAVPGRWGETSGILLNSVLPPAGSPPFINNPTASNPVMPFPGLIYNNPVRAGRSDYVFGTNDTMDDDFDSIDPPLSQYIAATNYYVDPTQPMPNIANVGQRFLPEHTDNFDNIGQRSVASERIRQFVLPIDPGGVGRVVGFMSRPNNDSDYGNGYDARGRTSFFRYFRPAGMPQEIRYPYGGIGATYVYPYPTGPSLNGSSFLGQRYMMPQLFPAGVTYAIPPSPYVVTGASDVSNNRYHGFQSMMTPEITMGTNPVTAQTIAAMGATPFDWDNSLNMSSGDVPSGYPNGVSTTVGMPPLAPPLGTNFVNNFAPTINPNATQPVGPPNYNSNPIYTSVNTSYGPNFGLDGNTQVPTAKFPIGYGNYQSPTDSQPYGSPVVNGYLLGSLNKDEADEMNLYTTSRYDMPYGPSDLEWLYRLQDVDGATLNSRLSKLAPISFLNPADGLTRRRLFSTDSWELTSFVYANDNPAPYAGVAYGAQTDHDFLYNSRFMPTASPSLEIMNQISANGTQINFSNLANPITTEYLPNPTFPSISPSYGTGFEAIMPNSASTVLSLPTALDTGSSNPFPLGLFDKPQIAAVSTSSPNSSSNAGVVTNYGNNSMVQVQTPSLAHRDRKINLNYPLPISHDPAEPVRQKWCRETYQMFKAILPPAAVDTPEELAALSQYVVNIIDFRDPDAAMTRFVNTDLIVTDALTKSTSPVQPTTGTAYDTTWNVSPPGVRFATSTDAGLLTVNTVTHFPYDPSLYSPDVTTPFLVQHGMEYNPIAINEVLGAQFQYGSNTTTGPGTPVLMSTSCLFVELVNTLTEEQNNSGSNNNSSAISLGGWDLIITPDNYGWGRPDPISGDVSSIAYPPLIPPVGVGTVATPPAPNQAAPLSQVKNFQFSASTPTLKAINNGAATYYVVGTTPPTGALNATITTNVTLPNTFLPTTVAPQSGNARYFWVYLRRPANPFEIDDLVYDHTSPKYRPNREMVVVDAMRFPFIDAGTTTMSGTVMGKDDKVQNAAPNDIYSARRLQPFRGGHLLPPATIAGTMATTRADGSSSLANGITTICPPSPAYAYGYTEQMSPSYVGTNGGKYVPSTAPPVGSTAPLTTQPFKSSIGTEGNPRDSVWTHMPFHDRDFTSVAELLLVPGCPPGLFTKQFVEEPYPGNVASQSTVTTKTNPTAPATQVTITTVVQPPIAPTTLTYATGSDDTTINATTPITAPNIYPLRTATNPYDYTGNTAGNVTTITTTTQPVGGRTNFGQEAVSFPAVGPTYISNPTPVAPTFPYLPDNFYYTAASVAPPSTLPSAYTHLTTEIGGWTGNGWHKMMEFVEVPSSANGAIGTADAGVNFDWFRTDVKPGLLNLNLIIDEEVFAGLFDDPRLNERLALYAPPGGSSTIPHIVTQLDANGYAATQYAIFGQKSLNQLNSPQDTSYFLPTPGTNTPQSFSDYTGRGYSVRDPDSQNYLQLPPNQPYFLYQQLHGLKAAFSDFLKLRHGGSGYLFAHGAGPTGSGDLFNPGWPQTQPIAADRPYRSMSYPDVNYTVMRPASLPPSPVDTANLPNYRYTATSPSLPTGMTGLFTYATNKPANPASNSTTYLQMNPFSAPINLVAGDTPSGPFQYIADPGVKNPFLAVQYINQNAPRNAPNSAAPYYPTNPYPGPPYPAFPYAVQPAAPPGGPAVTPQAAPFPPPIPPTPARRLIQVPDIDTSTALTPYSPTTPTYPLTPAFPSSNASLSSSLDGTAAMNYSVNQQVKTLMLSSGSNNPPTLVPGTRAVFLPDNNTPQVSTTNAPLTIPASPSFVAAANNYLGAGQDSLPPGSPPPPGLPPINDYRQHPLYRTEMLQKVMNLTTVRTHQFAVWITVGFFEVVKPGTTELGIPDVLGQELGLTAGRNVRYRSFFTLDRTKATGFNPYYPGNFRDVVTYRRRIE